MYITLAESGLNRGYIGSYSGNAQDVDFGTYSGNDNGKVHLTTQNAPRLTVDGDGNVGIGTTNPQQIFSVAGGMNIDQNDQNIGTTANMLRFGSNSGEGISSNRTSGVWSLDFYSNSLRRMTITNGGNIGIGLTNPSAKLELRGALGFSSTTKRWEMNYDSTAGYFYIDEFGSGRRLAIKNGGNVGINTTNPQKTLDVNGDVNIQNKIFLNNSTGNNGQVLTSGGPSGSPSWTTTAYGTADRFLYKVNGQSLAYNSSFIDTVFFDQVYALSGALSYNSATGIFTVNKSGLYEIKGCFASTATIQSNGECFSSLLLFTPGGSFEISRNTFITLNNGSTYIGASSTTTDLPLYFSAGSTFFFFGVVVASNPLTMGFTATPLSIVLVAE